MSMTADKPHRAGLRSLQPLLFCKSHFASDFHVIEVAVQHAVLVKVNFIAVRRFNKAITLLGKKPDHAAGWISLVRLYVGSLASGIVLKLSPRGIKGFANCDFEVLTRSLNFPLFLAFYFPHIF